MSVGGSWRLVHQLVCAAFHGPRPDGKEVCHRDGDWQNNRPENLYWGTRSENMLDAVRHGTHGNARKVRCKYGHSYAGRNVIRLKGGRRDCRECVNRRNREYRERKATT